MSSLYSFENALHDSQQLLRFEGFRDVGVGPGTESRNAIGRFVFGREEDDRYETRARRGAQITHKGVAIHARHANVTDDQPSKRFGNADHPFASAASRLH